MGLMGFLDGHGDMSPTPDIRSSDLFSGHECQPMELGAQAEGLKDFPEPKGNSHQCSI